MINHMLRRRLNWHENEYISAGIGDVVNTLDGFYIYKETKSKILAVAHLDTVQQGKKFKIKGNKILQSPRVDNRLGAHIILDILPAVGIETDILLTTNEEWAQSTAEDFNTNPPTTKQYNWIIEFDRTGSDVVTYQYEDENWLEAVELMFPTIGIGSYSDISELGALNASALNVGIGMYKYHAADAYADLRITSQMISRFAKFYKLFKDTHFEHTTEHLNWRTNWSSYNEASWYKIDSDGEWNDKRDFNCKIDHCYDSNCIPEQCIYCGTWQHGQEAILTYEEGSCAWCTDRHMNYIARVEKENIKQLKDNN